MVPFHVYCHMYFYINFTMTVHTVISSLSALFVKCKCRAGLSPDLHDFDQIRSIARPTDVPDTGLLCDLLWSDPDKDIQGWGDNDRGVSFTFGSDVVTKFLNRHDLDLICRAHQVGGSTAFFFFFFFSVYFYI